MILYNVWVRLSCDVELLCCWGGKKGKKEQNWSVSAGWSGSEWSGEVIKTVLQRGSERKRGIDGG